MYLLFGVADPEYSSGFRGRGNGAMNPTGPVKISHKKMAAKGGHIDFMFLAPRTRPLDPLLEYFPLEH